MDKLVVHAYKQLKNMGEDEILHQTIQIFRRYNNTGRFKPAAIRNEASHWSSDELFVVSLKRTSGSGEVAISYEYVESLNEVRVCEEQSDAQRCHGRLLLRGSLLTS